MQSRKTNLFFTRHARTSPTNLFWSEVEYIVKELILLLLPKLNEVTVNSQLLEKEKPKD